MHPMAYDFVKRVMERREIEDRLSSAWPYPTRGRVLELGSYNVNGSVRDLFSEAAQYIGIDSRRGPGVDLIADACWIDGNHSWDFVVCTEVLEHHDQPELILFAANRSLKPGGVFILTCAAPPRPPHRADGEPGEPVNEYYQNVGPEWLESKLWMLFDDVVVEYHRERGDFYAVAVQPPPVVPHG